MTLLCAEGDRQSADAALGWKGNVVDLDDDGRDEFCPRCAATEFGASETRGQLDA